MKKFLPILFLILFPLLAFAAPQAEYPAGDPLALPVEVLDSPYQENWYGPRVVRLTAPNNQALHVVSMTAHPAAWSFDVNFDGQEDLVVMVHFGATNALYRLFLWQDGQYVPAEDGIDEGLYNVAFYPGQKLVGSHLNNGHAGALYEDILFQWQGTRLLPLRRAVCEEKQETSYQPEGYTTRVLNQVLQARVYAPGADGEAEALFDETFDIAAQGMEAAYDGFYQRTQAALWQGLE